MMTGVSGEEKGGEELPGAQAGVDGEYYGA